MRVPAAKSSGLWVQPWSITTQRHAAVSPAAGGSKSLNVRVPAAQVKLLSTKPSARRPDDDRRLGTTVADHVVSDVAGSASLAPAAT